MRRKIGKAFISIGAVGIGASTLAQQHHVSLGFACLAFLGAVLL